MRAFYNVISFFMFFIGICSFIISTIGCVIFYNIEDFYIFGIVSCFSLILIFLGIYWKNHPPIKFTTWLISPIKRKLTKRKFRKWKYRIGDRCKTTVGHCLYTVEIINYHDYRYDGKYSKPYYECKIIGYKDFIIRPELELHALYEFNLDNTAEMFGYIENELRKNGVLKTQT